MNRCGWLPNLGQSTDANLDNAFSQTPGLCSGVFNLGARLSLSLMCLCLLLACQDKAINDPHTDYDDDANVRFSVFSERPKTLDPARSYSSNEALFTAQVYEPPLQYHYLKRPYQLVPLTAAQMPKVEYFDAQDRKLDKAADDKTIAYSLVTIKIKPGIRYAPHPAFAKRDATHYSYYPLDSDRYNTLSDFEHTDTRELTAQDYVYQLKRLAAPHVRSPIYGFMSDYITGMKTLNAQLRAAKARSSDAQKNGFIDLRQYTLPGVKALDRYTYQIRLKGKYPQFLYWLAMPFFSPMPWEADRFYSQYDLQDNNITLDWYPIGTGPYQLLENNPNLRMVLSRNPNYHGETYPTQGEAGDDALGLLDASGQSMPFIDTHVFSLEKESIPLWSKFLQGYYDQSGISADSFDQAIRMNRQGEAELTAKMKKRGIKLYSAVEPSIFYFGFNMQDPVVGGYTDKARALRHAISIAIDYEEFISIFANGRGIPAQGPIPPGIDGYAAPPEDINDIVYDWKNGKLIRRSLDEAKQLLVKAGYPNGVDPKTRKRLVLNLDVPLAHGPDSKARLDWMRKQFNKLGISLNVRATQYNRFQEKMRTGNAQLFEWGWMADYPDAENFLFLLYGPNSKVGHGGENAANYYNARYDALFEQVKNMTPSAKRTDLIAQMVQLARTDAPWAFGYHPKKLALVHQWVSPIKPASFGNSTMKYMRLNAKLRQQLNERWNEPVFWPIATLFALLVLFLLPVMLAYRRHERECALAKEDPSSER